MKMAESRAVLANDDVTEPVYSEIKQGLWWKGVDGVGKTETGS
jgi:hypothetical protein